MFANLVITVSRKRMPKFSKIEIFLFFFFIIMFLGIFFSFQPIFEIPADLTNVLAKINVREIFSKDLSRGWVFAKLKIIGLLKIGVREN